MIVTLLWLNTRFRLVSCDDLYIHIKNYFIEQFNTTHNTPFTWTLKYYPKKSSLIKVKHDCSPCHGTSTCKTGQRTKSTEWHQLQKSTIHSAQVNWSPPNFFISFETKNIPQLFSYIQLSNKQTHVKELHPFVKWKVKSFY